MEKRLMNKKIIGLIVAAVIICAAIAVAAVCLTSPAETPRTPTGELDFSVSGQSDCLRFLNSSVPTFYVPFTVDTNQNMQLTINATKMPGGVNGWTDVYVYNDYWDGGTNHTCKAMDLYPILDDIRAANLEVKANQPYVSTFGNTDATPKSFTVFFVVPPGGQSAFHVTLKPT
jgi:hypothetical protein